ncbi:MAG: hypothetical protein LBK82_01765, partial [Planctomycetaceae bacterium]|nr:hypothetical protein [Planctomycetaceae bacterium]
VQSISFFSRDDRKKVFRHQTYNKSSDLLRFSYQDLVNILAEPDEELPELLHNGIFFIDELSTPQAAEFIVQQLKDEDQTIPIT